MITFGYDLDFFWRAAQATLHGASPYTVGGFFSPYPTALFFVPFALLPFRIAYALWTGGKLALLANAGDRWGFLKALLFFPVAFDLVQGQLDLFIFLIALRSNWLGLTLSTLRPQLAIWIIPWLALQWWKDRRWEQFGKSALGVGALFSVSTIVEPRWWQNWLNAPSVAWVYNRQSASLFGLAQILPFSQLEVVIAISILAALALVLLKPKTSHAYWQWVALFNPVANVYSLVILFDQVDWMVIALGFFALPVSEQLRTNAVWASIPLYLMFKDRYLSSRISNSKPAITKNSCPT